MNSNLFVLDIGTRSIVGLLCRMDGGKIEVLHSHTEFHPQRAMLDGQIHDVGQVSSVISKVKDIIEGNCGYPLTRAAIAAAGRALSTIGAKGKLDMGSSREITMEDLRQLEVDALADARSQLDQSSPLYCVGYSPIRFTLDGYDIKNPLAQRGQVIETDIIATFLPRVVVDSLFSALAKSGLEVASLTLEPIAAMEVAVPPSLRMLNLALVDIGAGTSDIAISKDGTILAYGMVDKAGDEITEVIAQHYLVDFNTAESVKLALSQSETIDFADVLGNKYSETVSDILSVVENIVDKFAAELAGVIKENNGGKSPAAVFCVGGGSQTPLLREYLSLHLDMPMERIGIRTHENLEEVICPDLTGPEVFTPIGIAKTSLARQDEQFIRVWINGQAITLFNVQKTTVAQALLHGGIDLPQDKLNFYFNNQEEELKVSSPVDILVNEVAAALETELGSGDRVHFQVKEQTSNVKLEDLDQDTSPMEITVDDTLIQIPPLRLVNGEPAGSQTPIKAGDRVEIRWPKTVGELASIMDLDLSSISLTVNGQRANLDTPIGNGDIVELAH